MVAPPQGWPLAVRCAVPVRVKLYTSSLALRRLRPCACARFRPLLQPWLSRAFGVLLWRAWQPHALLPFWQRFSPALALGSYRIPVDHSGRDAVMSIVESKLSLSWRCICCMSTNRVRCGRKPSKVGCVLVCASMPQPKNLLRLYGCCIHSKFSCLRMSCKYDKSCIADLRSALGNFLCLSMRCMPCIAMAGPLPHDVWHTLYHNHNPINILRCRYYISWGIATMWSTQCHQLPLMVRTPVKVMCFPSSTPERGSAAPGR